MTTDDTYPTLDLALRVGELLLSSGAGAADVSVQMQNVCIACGLRSVSASVTFTELQLTHQQSPDEPGLIQVRDVRQREIDYEDLTRVDWLVRDLVSGAIDRDEARSRLAQIVSPPATIARGGLSPSPGASWGWASRSCSAPGR